MSTLLKVKKDNITYLTTKNILIQRARKEFWFFCRVLAPDFYKKDREYLKVLCNTLQDLYEGKLKVNDNVTNKLIINMPPQHGKSRTLINFCMWCLGKSSKNRIITVSYNEHTASDFSKYARDGILYKSDELKYISYCDIFPDRKIKKGSSSSFKWALEGEHFNYLGTGIGGSITSKSGNIRIIDDPIKNLEDAVNENKLDKIWEYYTGTFLSRQSGEHIDIINHTRWSETDLCGRVLEKQKDKWYILKFEAYDEKTDKMLCSELLSKKDYFELKSIMLPDIFWANYHQQIVSTTKSLYKQFKTYTDISRIQFERIVSYTDTADQGNDYHCMIIAGLKEFALYILYIYYSMDPMEITEPKCTGLLNEYNTTIAWIESNNGGRGYARAIQKLLRDKYGTGKPVIKWFHQGENKEARIITNSHYVQEYVYYPDDWEYRFPEYAKHIKKYIRGGKNQKDDGADCITGLCEKTMRVKKPFY